MRGVDRGPVPLNEKYVAGAAVGTVARDGRCRPDFVPTRLVLVRHGESQASVARSIGGPRTCSGLSDLGRQQCERLAVRLAETGELADVVLYASHYPRAIETAELIAPGVRRTPRCTSRPGSASTTPARTATG